MSTENTPKSFDSPWDQLNQIDPERALQIHPNDTYRLNRALTLWATTGQIPSNLAPVFTQEFPAIFVVINPENEILKDRIEKRATQMIDEDGWLLEVKSLLGTRWEPFMLSKKLIGYNHIVSVLRQQEEFSQDLLIKVIQQETWQYAKRQKKFIKRLLLLLEKEKSQNKGLIEVINTSTNPFDSLTSVFSCFNSLIQ